MCRCTLLFHVRGAATLLIRQTRETARACLLAKSSGGAREGVSRDVPLYRYVSTLQQLHLLFDVAAVEVSYPAWNMCWEHDDTQAR